MQIKAAVVRTRGGPFTLEPCELTAPREGEVLVELEACGVCHTDLTARDHDLGAALPAVLGHEGVGIVRALGEGVSEFALGDRVLMNFGSCGYCSKCRSGAPGYCKSAALNLRGTRQDGSSPVLLDGAPITGHFFAQSSFATHAVTSTRNMVKLAHDLPPELMAPLACGVQTGMASVLIALAATSEDSIAVFGCGTVGMAAIMAARILGCTRIIGVDLDDSRLALARELGATHTINSSNENAGKAIRALGGVSKALDNTGIPAVIETAFNALQSQGVLVCAGVSAPGTRLGIDAAQLVYSGRTLRGTIEGDAVPREFVPRMIAWYRQGLLPLEKLVKTYAFEDINQAVDDIKQTRVIKAVLCMHPLEGTVT
jgi:aryl-alcohol dehydrogenase